MESAIFENPDALKMWVWMLSRATHKEHNQMVGNQNVCINAGSFVFGRRAAATVLGMSESKIYRLLKLIENDGMIEVKSNNKFSVITIVNWGVYQGNEREQRTTNEQQTNNKRTTNEQQTNTNKNVKNDKNEKEINIGVPPEPSKEDWREKAGR